MNTAIFRLSLKNVLRGRSRVFLCILSVSVGIAALVLLYCVGTGGQNAAMDLLHGFGFSGSLIVPNTGTSRSSPLIAEDADYIAENIQGVSDAIPFTTRYGAVRSDRASEDAVIWGVGKEMERFIDMKLVYGSLFTPENIREGARLCVIDRDTALRMYGRENAVGRSITVMLEGVSEIFTVSAVTDGGMSVLGGITGGAAPLFVYIPGGALAELTGETGVAQIAVRIDGDDPERVTRSICRLLDTKYEDSVGYTVQDLDGYISEVNGVMQLVKLLLVAAASVSLVVSGIGVMNAMFSSVKERRQEIGLCLAIGATPAQIGLGFVLEAAMITAIGGILGSFVGIMLSYAAGSLLGLSFTVQPVVAIVVAGIMVLIGLAFGTLPALRAARLAPVDTLREE